MPLNPITENLYYINRDGDKQNQRIVVSAPTKYPIVWQISKLENSKPFGLQKLTMTQDQWDGNKDYIDKEEQAGGDLFAMYANYYSSAVVPSEEGDIYTMSIKLTSNSNKIKIGGSYKLITAQLVDSNESDITNAYLEFFDNAEWSCFIGDEDIDDDFITWLEQDNSSQIKIKLSNNRQYISKIMTVRCTVRINERDINGELQFEISAL